MLTRSEAPALEMEKAAICLHFVENGAPAPTARHPYPDCPVMRSMELDLLSYRFQLEPPFGSQCETHGKVPLQIHFPDTLIYQSEGREVTLTCPTPLISVNCIVSSTRFLRSGLSVWHLVLTPETGGRFTEFDLIKLIQLYDGRTESTHLDKDVWFVIPDGRRVQVGTLLSSVYATAPSNASVRAGTIQLLTGDQKWGDKTLPELLAVLGEPPGECDNLVQSDWLKDATTEGKALKACCGVVSGIFDFDQLDVDELGDILEPTVPDSDGLVRIQRATLTVITAGDRPMESCAGTVGISPYLIIPHAALLHNEAMVDAADRELESALSDPRARLKRLEDAHASADLLLNRLYLPNVFNYRSERALFQRGAAERGSDERRTGALTKLVEIDTRISRMWEERRERGQMCIAILLSLISVLQLKDIVFTMVGSGGGTAARWAVLGAAALALALLMTFFWRLGVRR